MVGLHRPLARLTSGSVQPDPAQPPDVAHAALGEPVCRDRGRDAVRGGELEDRVRRVVDAARPLLGALEAEAGRVELVGDLDQAAGVDAVVGRVEDPALGQRLLDARVGQLVVGGAAHDPSPDSTSTTSSVSAPPSAQGA